MGFDPPVVVFDACVLYPFHTRNLLIQCGVERLVQPRWTQAIHDEWIRNLAGASPAIPTERLYRLRDLMNRVLPSAEIRGYEHHIAGLHLPDPDDRHVIAAAIAAGATQIITWNIRDFPVSQCALTNDEGTGFQGESSRLLLAVQQRLKVAATMQYADDVNRSRGRVVNDKI